jgi:WD40 repeat protein
VDLYGDPLPNGALARMGTVRLRHDNSGSLITVFSPDGKVIATGDRRSLRLWEAGTGKLIRQIQENYQFGNILFSPDGKWLAVQEKGGICLLEPSTGRLRQRIPSAGYPFTVSADAQLLVTDSNNGTVTVWNTVTAGQALRLQGHEEGVISAAFTPDGRTLVTLCRGKKLCRWDMRTGALQKAFSLPLPHWRTLSLAPDARTLAVVPYSREAVQLWDTETGKERIRLQGAPACAGWGLAFTPDSRTLATNWIEDGADEATISLWDATTGRPLRRFQVPAQTAEQLQFAPGGRTLLSADTGPLVYLWDTATGKALLWWPAHEGYISALGFSPDGRTLLSSSSDGTIRFWDPATGRPGHVLQGPHRLGVYALAVLPDGQAVLSPGPDGILRLWDFASGKEIRRLAVEEKPAAIRDIGYRVLCLGVTADGSTAAAFSCRVGPAKAGEPQYLLHTWDLTTGKVQCRRPVDSPNQNLEVRAFSPDLRAYVSLLDPTSVPTMPANATIPPGTTLVEFKGLASGRHLLVLSQPDHYGHRQVFSPDGRLLATVTYRLRRENNEDRVDRHSVHLWEVASGKERLTIVCPESGHPYRFGQLAFSRDGRWLATERIDGTIQVWEVATGEELVRHTNSPARVYCLAFTPDGKALAAGYVDSTILLWDVSPAAQRRHPPQPARASDLEAWWADLADPDATRAHVAIGKLTAVPQQAVELLRTRLVPAESVPADKRRQLLDDLDSNEFARREAASGELADLEERVFPALEEALRSKPSPEKRRRIETLLGASHFVRLPRTLRALRAVEVLEHVGTAEARRIIEAQSRGASEARLTQEAKASLKRLRQPPGAASDKESAK